MSIPLEGVRVVELARYVAGPFCEPLPSGLGADSDVVLGALA